MEISALVEPSYFENMLTGRDFQDKLYRSIFQAVLYSDIFDYPLTIEEIHRYLVGVQAPIESVYEAIHSERLLSTLIDHQEGFFYLQGRKELVEKRIARTEWAEIKWPQAFSYASMIAKIPYVRMIAITGALALNNVERDADLDFLIVTTTGRLWLCRALVLIIVHLAKKSQIEVCPNYFLSENVLTIRERNLYTAHELAQMVPLFGWNVYTRMRWINQWLFEFLPNASGPPSHDLCVPPQTQIKDHPIKSVSEFLLHTFPGAWAERWEMERKIDKLSSSINGAKETSFSPDYCKGHFHNHSTKTLIEFENRLTRLRLKQ